MAVSVNHAMLVGAFEYSIEESRRDGIHVVDNLIDWRKNFGSRTNRITKLYGGMAHHAGSEIAPSRVVNYVRALGTGSIRPDIGGGLCNTSSVRAGHYPGSDGKPTIVVLGANYMNHAGKGDSSILRELEDGDVDVAGEIKPGADNTFLNRYLLGDEGVGSYTDESQQRAVVVFYSHVFWKLGLTSDRDRDGKFAPLIGHRESTKRKIDPSRADMAKMRHDMQEFIKQRYFGETSTSDYVPGAPVVEPLSAKTESTGSTGFSNPHTPLSVDGQWGNQTTRALQHVLKEKYNAWGLNGPLVVDGLIGKNTYRALQRVLNQESKAGLAEDGIFGPQTRRALQRYVGTNADGIVGPNTVSALQRKINGGF